ncbi:MAG: B12-binding domain-containing radical SAM protein [Armatimonadota bacterium]
MRVLLVSPQHPDTFWGFKYALRFISRKASFPPLGLLTVAAFLPREWETRVSDLNVAPLKDRDILWADYVFISAMSVQQASARKVIDRCKALGARVVAGGPLFTAAPDEFPDVDHLVLNEAEITLPPFLTDLSRGVPQRVYASEVRADLRTTPLPRWDLLNHKHYASMSLQYSRGCPYDCEFCDITVLYGRSPRTKDASQVIAELDALYATGWRGGVFFVDDNFIGNKVKVKREILPAIIAWMQAKKHPFNYFTEASINLADDDELMRLMAQAGFDTVFIGIESPNEDSLVECQKIPNKDRDLIASVKKIQQAGLQVQGGFIVGFDSDPASIFDRLIAFIQESGIVTAMVGLLNAPRKTKLYQRLHSEGRLLQDISGDNTDLSMNFIPRLNPDVLLNGYRDIVKTIYAPREYYQRIRQFFRVYRPAKRTYRFRFVYLNALFKSALLLGILGKGRIYYWKLFFWTLFTRPSLFPLAITLFVYGYHFRTVFEKQCASLERRAVLNNT